jgi:hypothetical protein
MFALIDLSKTNKTSVKLLNRAYDLWYSNFTDILNESSEELKPDYFYRCKYVSVLYDQDIIKAMCLHNVFDFGASGVSELDYFKPLNPFLKESFLKEKIRILSVEWVLVNPELRARFTKVQYADIIMGLAFKVLSDSGLDAAMGFSRTDLKADLVAEKFGTKKLDLIKRHNIECGVMLLRKNDLVKHPFKKTQEVIDQEYLSRTDYTYFKYTNQYEQEVAS